MLRDRRLLEVRQELAADLHDEVGGYLAGMLMKIDLMLKGPALRETQLAAIRNLASRAVFGLKDGLWSLDTKTDNAQQLWDRYKRIAQESLEPFDIPYKFSSSRGLGSIPLTLIEKRNLLFTLKECLNNAIKHGDGKGVWFEWKSQNDGKHNIIVRNGIRSSDREDDADGLGIENMQRRIQRINGSLQTGQSNGMFTVEIKINLRHDKIGRD
jgi:signal transduction histidine kinase